MVVPYTTGKLFRCLVQIPDTGSDKDVNPSVCNLGRTSIASTVFVPSNLQLNTNTLGLTPVATRISVSKANKRKISDEVEKEQNIKLAPKVIRIDTTSNISSKPILPVSIPRCYLVAAYDPDIEIRKLKQEREELRKKTEDLKRENRRLSNEYEDLMKENRRLKDENVCLDSVLKTLEGINTKLPYGRTPSRSGNLVSQ